MGRIILSIFLLIILTSFTNVKIDEKLEANNYIYDELTYFTVQLIEDIKIKSENIDITTKESLTVEKELKIKSVAIATMIDENNYEIFNVTAYTNGYESTQKRKGEDGYGITASGEKTKAMHTAACPKSMPFGTELYIPYFDNTFVCEDRGGAIKAGKLDIYMETVDEALEFGRRKLEVRVIKREES